MYAYPPRVFDLVAAFRLLAIPVLILTAVGFWLWRPQRAARGLDALTWFVAATGAMLLGWRSLENPASSPNEIDRTLVHLARGALQLALPAGLICIIRRMQRAGRKVSWSQTTFTTLMVLLGLTSLLIPAMANVRPSMWRSLCTNNIKAIGDGLFEHHKQRGTFPDAVAGDPPVSWRVSLLPHLDAGDVFARYDQSRAWNESTNRPLMSTRLPVYLCPAEVARGDYDSGEPAFTSYVLPVGPNTLFPGGKGGALGAIPDGTSRTLLLIEACGSGIVWTEPRDMDVTTAPVGINLPGNARGLSEGVFSSRHYGSDSPLVNALYADGAVRMLTGKISPEVLSQLLDRRDGQPMGEF